MRRPVTAVGAAGLAALGLLSAGVPPARAQSDCSIAFERWAKLSSARVIPNNTATRGACVAADATRSDLLEGLARVRGVCAESADQISDMLNANLSFIASLAVCPPAPGASSPSTAGHGDPGEGWVTRSAPVLERPKVAAPVPAAPPASPPAVPTGGPRLISPAPPVAPPPPAAPPRAVAAVPVPVAPVPAAPSGPAPAPPCLEIGRTQSDTFALVNHRCRGHTVLAVIETQAASGETSCKGYSISQSLAVRSSAAPPRVNYECVLSQGPCNKDRLGDMFPECDW